MTAIYIFKKILGGLLMPVPTLALLLVFTGAFWWKIMPKGLRFFWVVFTGVFIVGGYGWISDPLLYSLENRYAAVENADLQDIGWIIVLGGGHGSSGNIFSDTTEASLKRALEGIRLARICPQAKIILSGGGRSEQTDAAAMYQALDAAGIGLSRIIIEDESLDTAQQARMIATMVARERCLLVTSAFHMQRAMQLFSARNVAVVAAPTDYRVVSHDWLADPLPSAGGFRNAEILLHEYWGLLWARLRGQI